MGSEMCIRDRHHGRTYEDRKKSSPDLYLDIMKLLIKAEDDINLLHANFDTTLHIAARKGNPIYLEVLLKSGARPDLPNKYGMTPLHEACRAGHAACAKLLAKYVDDLSPRAKSGFTPLHFACRGGYKLTMGVMMKKGARNDIRANNGLTPLDML